MLTGFPPPTGAGGSAARNPGRRRGSSWLLRFTEACLVLHVHTTCIRGEQDGPLFDTPALLSSKARILVENNQSDLSDEAGLQKGHLSSHLPSISHDGLLSRRRAHVAVEKPAWGDKDRLVQGTSERHPEGAAVSITFRTPGGVANQETRFSCCIRGLVEGVEYQVLVTVCRGASIILYHESLLDRAPSIFLYDFNSLIFDKLQYFMLWYGYIYLFCFSICLFLLLFFFIRLFNLNNLFRLNTGLIVNRIFMSNVLFILFFTFLILNSLMCFYQNILYLSINS